MDTPDLSETNLGKSFFDMSPDQRIGLDVQRTRIFVILPSCGPFPPAMAIFVRFFRIFRVRFSSIDLLYCDSIRPRRRFLPSVRFGNCCRRLWKIVCCGVLNPFHPLHHFVGNAASSYVTLWVKEDNQFRIFEIGNIRIKPICI